MMCQLHQQLTGQLLLYQLRPQPCLSEEATQHPEQATQHPDQSIWHPNHLLAKLQQQMHLLHQPLPSRATALALTAPSLAGQQQQGCRPTSCVRQELPWGCGNSCMKLHPHLLLYWPLSTGMPWQPGQSASGQTTLLPEGAFLEVEKSIFVISRYALEIFLGISVFRPHVGCSVVQIQAAQCFCCIAQDMGVHLVFTSLPYFFNYSVADVKAAHLQSATELTSSCVRICRP